MAVVANQGGEVLQGNLVLLLLFQVVVGVEQQHIPDASLQKGDTVMNMDGGA